MINSSVFGKTMEDVIKHRDIKLATTEKRQKMVFLNFMRNRNEKKNPVYLGQSVLDASKIRWLHIFYRNRRCLYRYCKKCWNKLWGSTTYKKKSDSINKR